MIFFKKKDKFVSNLEDILYEFYKNIEMNYNMSQKLYENTKYEYDSEYLQYITFHKDDIKIQIFKNYTSCWIGIYINNIKIYDDIKGSKNKWLHKLSPEMIEYISNYLKDIDEYNRQCKTNNLKKTYKQFIEQKELVKKEKEYEQYKNEKQQLINKFKNDNK